MQGNRGTGTRPEIALRSALHRRGLRFRVGIRPVTAIPVRADVVFTKQRVAVFVDGCFWHACPTHFNPPRTNPQYWSAKIARNLERDRAVDAALTAAGWRVVHVWEHEPAAEAAQRLAVHLRRRSDDPELV